MQDVPMMAMRLDPTIVGNNIRRKLTNEGIVSVVVMCNFSGAYSEVAPDRCEASLFSGGVCVYVPVIYAVRCNADVTLPRSGFKSTCIFPG